MERERQHLRESEKVYDLLIERMDREGKTLTEQVRNISNIGLVPLAFLAASSVGVKSFTANEYWKNKESDRQKVKNRVLRYEMRRFRLVRDRK
jgi:hypothetical protein